ncbi:MAG: glycerol kinase GlpK [Henriciella sp.]
MPERPLILALDQGTTSSRAVAVDSTGAMIATAQQPFEQLFPDDGWVEHRPDDIWQTTLSSARTVLKQVSEEQLGDVVSLGITNQRETVLIWNRATGQPVCNALVWQDRRTAEVCRDLFERGHQDMIRAKTGLLLDPYFSASKIAWILDHVDGARAAAERGELAFGTVDTFLIWKLTSGQSHLTDETNASRTSLFNIHTGEWDQELLDLFNIPAALLPKVQTSSSDFGMTDPAILGRSLPIHAVAGDQQSAAFGQGCINPGMTKATYGTGCFVLVNTGTKAVLSSNQLLTTRACRIGHEPVFALEGSIFIAGAVAQWLRDELNLVATSAETEPVAAGNSDNGGVYLVPAFTGLGAPHWNSEARGAIFGLTRQSNRADIVRAAIESVAYQTHDLVAALKADGVVPDLIRTDGGMAANSWLMQFLASITGISLQRAASLETTALGVAYLAGLKSGVWQHIDEVKDLAGPYQSFSPDMPEDVRAALLREWDIAVQTTQFRAKLQSESKAL